MEIKNQVRISKYFNLTFWYVRCWLEVFREVFVRMLCSMYFDQRMRLNGMVHHLANSLEKMAIGRALAHLSFI